MSDRAIPVNTQQPAAAPGESTSRTGTPVVVGMMRASGRPGAAALAAAHAAAMRGASLFYFNPVHVDIGTGSLRGWTYEPGGWREVDSRLPDVVINDFSSRKHGKVWEYLQARVPFTSPFLGDKIEIMKRMEERNFYNRLQIPTRSITSFDVLLRMIERHGKVVAKPRDGGQGRDVFFIGKLDEGYSINADSAWRNGDRDDLEKFYDEKLHDKKFIVQRYIESVTKHGLPFDVRLHARRNGKGDWEVLRVYPRIGSGRTITSNYSAGGSIADLRSFLRDHYGERADAVRRELMRLASEMPRRFQELYDDRTIDAVGIDIGLDASGRPWLFEVNHFPWTKFFELEAAILRVDYALFVASKRGEP